jgi:hypothetical protein
MSKDPPKKKRSLVTIRELEFDDLSAVFHLGEKLFTSRFETDDGIMHSNPGE